MDIFQRIESARAEFTKTENKIYDFLQRQPETAAFCTIIQMAELCGCSKSAILRFCQKIGYTGYSEFCYDLIQYNRQNRSVSDGDADEWMISCMSPYENALLEMQKMGSEEMISLVKSIKDAPVVRTLGLGESGFCARQLASDLNLLGKPAIAVTDMIGIFPHCRCGAPSGALYLFSVNGNCKAYQELPRAIKDCKAQLVLVTNSAKAPLRKYADKIIKLPMVLHRGGVQLDVHGLVFIFISILNEYYRQMV